MAAPVIVVLLFTASLPLLSAAPPVAHQSIPKVGYAASTQGAFAFVSNFEDGLLDGWTSVTGSAPSVSTSTTYSGEYSLASSGSSSVPQTDVANHGFVTGDAFISFQVAIDAGTGSGYFGIYSGAASSPSAVALVGVAGGDVFAGANLGSLQDIGPVPTGTAYPAGWVLISANVYDASTHKDPTAGWVMQVYVDQTIAPNLTPSVPEASAYSGALIETTGGAVHYSDIVVSTYEMATTIPGYNNMEGYGQGSGLLVTLLPPFTTLSAEMDLNSWDTPQTGILSFQINAMNFYGTTSTTSSCVGFYQLGIDLNPDGYIAPWYVPGRNCIAHYFMNSQNPAIQNGIYAGPDTRLQVSITDDQSAKEVVFTIVVTSSTLGSQTFTASRPYNGTEFYGTYTQLEFQPCCNLFPIQDYTFSGELYNMQTTRAGGTPQSLPAGYMLPFMLDAPTSWNLGYYQGSVSGYQQAA